MIRSSTLTRRKSFLSDQEEKDSIVEHFEQVQVRIDELTRQAKHLASVLKKKVSVDKDHVKAIQKLTLGMHEDSNIRQLKFKGSLDAHWSNVKDQLAAEAMHVSRVTSTLEQQALQPLQVYMLADLEKRFHNLVQEGRKTIKEHINARSALSKTKDKYYGITSEWEGSLLAIYGESGDSWSPAPGNKLHERETILCRRMEEGKAEYEAMVSQTNALQKEILGTTLPQIVEAIRNVAENMAAVLNNTLKCFSTMQQSLSSGQQRESREQFDAAQYCHEVIFNRITLASLPHPQAYHFEEFPFKDDSLKVQARKVQYLCMSKLSAKELANRGHQFLANGDKRKSAVVSSHPVPSHQREQIQQRTRATTDTTADVYLISTCLEYLSQPFALKEEGLFRVSGDNSIMKSILADFRGGRASKEFLRQTVMNQKDPNNISGLLKMHLRENNLLTNASAAVIIRNITRDMKGLLDLVLTSLSSLEIQLLTKIIRLLHTLVQEPWRVENKMSPHTLGIACGLSLFPQLDPSKATAFTHYLIDNFDLLQESHTLL